MTENDVAVIGGGIAGLAASIYLVNAGRKVTLYESSDQLGGLGTFFQYQNHSFERFYHCILPNDEHLLSLLSVLEIHEDVYWKKSSFAMYAENCLYPLNTPRDLLSFKVLSLIDRLRLGITALYARSCSDKNLDQTTTAAWLKPVSGQRAFARFFQPLLECKFGDRFSEVPALWFWKRFNREKASASEVKGYIRKGYRGITDRIVSYLEKEGAKLLMNCPIERIEIDSSGRPNIIAKESATPFNQVLYTGPFRLFPKLVGKGVDISQLDPTIDAQGVINVVLILTRSLSPHYWIATPDEAIPFQGIVETSNVIEHSDTSGLKLVYLMKYLHRSDPHFLRKDAEIQNEYVSALKRLFPELRSEDIKEVFVFRAPFVETVYTTGYLQKKPPLELMNGRIFLATTAQVYPDVTSWNGSTGLSKLAVNEMLKYPYLTASNE